MKLEINQEAPNFSLYNSSRELVTLNDYRGKKVVLLFYPAAFTGTCTKELCSVRDDLSWYNDVNAVVFGISTDPLYSLHVYKKEQNLNFELLADFNKEVCALYGTQYEVFNYGMKGVAKRSAFVIDETGKITYIEILDNASEIPDFNKIKNALR